MSGSGRHPSFRLTQGFRRIVILNIRARRLDKLGCFEAGRGQRAGVCCATRGVIIMVPIETMSLPGLERVPDEWQRH